MKIDQKFCNSMLISRLLANLHQVNFGTLNNLLKFSEIIEFLFEQSEFELGVGVIVLCFFTGDGLVQSGTIQMSRLFVKVYSKQFIVNNL